MASGELFAKELISAADGVLWQSTPPALTLGVLRLSLKRIETVQSWLGDRRDRATRG